MTNRLFTENKNIKENVKNDIFLKQQVERIKSDSEKFANKDIAALTYTSFKKFYVTGSRKEYEYEYFLHRRRLNDFAILNILYDGIETEQVQTGVIYVRFTDNEVVKLSIFDIILTQFDKNSLFINYQSYYL